MIRSLTMGFTIPRYMFLRGGEGGVADSDEEEEVWRVCAGFSPNSLMLIIKKSSGCVCVCVLCLFIVSVKLRRQK